MSIRRASLSTDALSNYALSPTHSSQNAHTPKSGKPATLFGHNSSFRTSLTGGLHAPAPAAGSESPSDEENFLLQEIEGNGGSTEDEEMECQNIIISMKDLPLSVEEGLEIASNPFRMAFRGDLERQYREWIHLYYIPSRIWLAVSAIFAELDVFTYGFMSRNTNIVIMHAVVVAQFSLIGLLSIPALYRYRRWLILGMGLHNFFWTGLATQQAVSQISGVHQNTFIVLPFYCSFACVMAAQIPVRFTMFIFVVFPVLNALIRTLVSYPLPSAVVLLVWWWLIAAWGYLFERITRQLYVWYRAAKLQQEHQLKLQKETQSLLLGLIPASVRQYLLSQRAASSEKQAEAQPVPAIKVGDSPKIHPAVEKKPQKAKVASSKTYSHSLIMMINLRSSSETSPLTSTLADELTKLVELHGFQKHSIEATRYTCIKMQDSDEIIRVFALTKAILKAAEDFGAGLSVGFAVHVCPVTTGLVVTSTSLRHATVSHGFALTSALASTVEQIEPSNGRLAVLQADLTKIDIAATSSVPQFITVGGGVAGSVPKQQVLMVDLSILPSDIIAGPSVAIEMSGNDSDSNKAAADASDAVDLLLSLLQRTSDESNVRKLGPEPSLNLKGFFSWKGITFEFPPHERNFRQFVLQALPELFYIWIGCQIYCGIWSFVSLFATVLPCRPYLPGSVFPWAFAHFGLLALACPIIRALVFHLRNALVQSERINLYLGSLLLIMICHYALSLVLVYKQPQLSSAEDWSDYVSAVLHGQPQYSVFENQVCINMLYNMAFFVQFTLYFCISVVPLHIRTSYRILASAILFLFNTVLTTVLFHHTDYKENALILVVFLMAVLVETLVRFFYKSLLTANRCHMDIQDTPAMQNRHTVMLASMPQRLLDAPDHTVYHANAAVILIHFPNLDYILAKASSGQQHQQHSAHDLSADDAFEDLTKLSSLVQAALDRHGVEGSIIHLTLQDGSCGFVILAPAMNEEPDFPRTIRLASQGILQELVGPSSRSLASPPIVRVACAVSAIVESHVNGSHHISGSAEKEAYALLPKCLVNKCMFGQSIPQLEIDTRGLIGVHSQSQSSTPMTSPKHSSAPNSSRFPPSVGKPNTNRRFSRESKTSRFSIHSKFSMRSKANSGESDTKSILSRFRRGGRGNFNANQFVYLSFIWSSSHTAENAEKVVKPETDKAVVVTDFDTSATSTPVVEKPTEDFSTKSAVTEFNAAYLHDMDVIVRVLRTTATRAFFQQDALNKNHVLMVLTTDYSLAATMAFKTFGALKEENAGKYLLGIGLTVGASPKFKSFLKVDTFQFVLSLATHNVTYPCPAQYGLPILMTSQVYQWAQNEYATKVLPTKGKPVHRLCEKLKETATDEWMYQLAESGKSNRFLRYNTAVGQYRSGKLTEAMASLKGYLDDHPTDNDALALAKAIDKAQSGDVLGVDEAIPSSAGNSADAVSMLKQRLQKAVQKRELIPGSVSDMQEHP